MNDNEQEKRRRLNEVVKSKIKGLGLDALFHQVDVTAKDDKPTAVPSNILPEQTPVPPPVSGVPFITAAADFFRRAGNKLLRRNNDFIIFDIGTSAVKALLLRHEKNAAQPQNVFHFPVPHLVAASEEKFKIFVQESLTSVLSKTPGKKATAVTILPRSSAIVKFITLPTQNKEEIKKMLIFEAEQHLPFSPSELETDYCILAKNHPGCDIILAAAKKEDIHRHLSLFESAGIHPAAITISSLALYNAGRLNFPAQGVCVQVHIGATFTDINIISDGIMRFSRSLEWGAKNFTLRLSAALNISFDNAEKIKKENGIILIKNADNQTQKHISDNARVWADELIGEIKRTIESFQLHMGIRDIAQIRLSGGGSRLINLNEYLRDTLRAKVIMEKPAAGIDPGLDIYARYFLELHPLLGVGENADGRHLYLNLLPETIQRSRQRQKQHIRQGIVAAVSLVVGFCVLTFPAWILSLRAQRIKALDAQLAALHSQTAAVQDLKEKIAKIEEYTAAKNSCMEILREMSIIIPDDITINRFSFEKNESVILTGIARSHSSAVNFSLKLNESPFFENVKIIYTRKKDIPGEEIVDFEIFCGLKSAEE